MSKSKRKKDANQPELAIHDPGQSRQPKLRKKADANGNGDEHVHAEQVTTVAHRPFDPKKAELPLHRRVDRGFLDYAGYVIRDRAIPNLADGQIGIFQSEGVIASFATCGLVRFVKYTHVKRLAGLQRSADNLRRLVGTENDLRAGPNPSREYRRNPVDRSAPTEARRSS